jgi:hypothetical protein
MEKAVVLLGQLTWLVVEQLRVLVVQVVNPVFLKKEIQF